jgi:hypothetical protein
MRQVVYSCQPKVEGLTKKKAVQNNDPPFISKITESELQAIAAVDFNQPGAYNWIKKITPSVADKKGVNALVKIFIHYRHYFYKSIYKRTYSTIFIL